MSSLDDPTRLYFMTPNSWRFLECENVYIPEKVPREVQALYAAEGWTRIFYQEFWRNGVICYPQIEGRPL